MWTNLLWDGIDTNVAACGINSNVCMKKVWIAVEQAEGMYTETM